MDYRTEQAAEREIASLEGENARLAAENAELRKYADAVAPLVEAAREYRTTLRSLVTDDSEAAEAKRQAVKVRLINAALKLEVPRDGLASTS